MGWRISAACMGTRPTLSRPKYPCCRQADTQQGHGMLSGLVSWNGTMCQGVARALLTQRACSRSKGRATSCRQAH